MNTIDGEIQGNPSVRRANMKNTESTVGKQALPLRGNNASNPGQDGITTEPVGTLSGEGINHSEKTETPIASTFRKAGVKPPSPALLARLAGLVFSSLPSNDPESGQEERELLSILIGVLKNNNDLKLLDSLFKTGSDQTRVISDSKTEMLKAAALRLESILLDKEPAISEIRAEAEIISGRLGKNLLLLVQNLGARMDPPFYYTEAVWQSSEGFLPFRMLAEWRKNGSDSKAGKELKKIMIDVMMSNLGRIIVSVFVRDNQLEIAFRTTDEKTRKHLSKELNSLTSTLTEIGFSTVVTVSSENSSTDEGENMPHLLREAIPVEEGNSSAQETELDILA